MSGRTRSSAGAPPAGLPTNDEIVPRSVVGSALSAKAAVTTDGRWLFADGYLLDPAANGALEALRRRGEIPPPSGGKHTIAMEALQRLYRGGRIARGAAAGTAGIEARLTRVLKRCAHVEASDAMLIVRGGIARWYAIVHDRMAPVGDAWTADEGREAIRTFFYIAGAEYASDGSARDVKSYRCSAAQARRAGLVLPEEVSGFRVSTAGNEPGDGVHLVARLFYRRHSTRDVTLSDIVEDAGDLAELERAMGERRGAVILCGATGDGKSTTGLKYIEALRRMHGGGIHVVELGDPVERLNPDILQMSVAGGDDRAGAATEWIRHFVRIHPHVGFLQEVRDAEAARLFYAYVLSGHAGVTTLHCGSANGALFRLMTLGLAPEELSDPDFARLIWRQTLVWELCDCALPLKDAVLSHSSVSETLVADLKRFGLCDRARARNREGCALCRRDDALEAALWSGYSRIRAVSEHIRPDARWLSLVRSRDPAGAYAHWLSGRPRTLGSRLRALVAAGRLDPVQAAARGAFSLEEGSGAWRSTIST